MSPVKNLLAATMAVMERITAGRSASFLFHSIEPKRKDKCRGSIDVDPEGPIVEKSHLLQSSSVLLFFFRSCSSRFSPSPAPPPVSLVPGDQRACYRTVANVHIHTTVNRRFPTQQEVCFYFRITLISILLLLLFF